MPTNRDAFEHNILLSALNSRPVAVQIVNAQAYGNDQHILPNMDADNMQCNVRRPPTLGNRSGGGNEERRRLTGPGRLDCFGQEGEEVAPLLDTGCSDT